MNEEIMNVENEEIAEVEETEVTNYEEDDGSGLSKLLVAGGGLLLGCGISFAIKKRKAIGAWVEARRVKKLRKKGYTIYEPDEILDSDDISEDDEVQENEETEE